MKILATIVVIILLICGGALWFLAGGSINEYVKLQIEKVGSELTEQKVSVQTVDIKAFQGAGSILALNLPNPEGYKAKNALTLGEITLDINVESLAKSPIVIDAIVIKDVKAFTELTSSGGANVKDLLDTIKKNTPASKPEAEESKESTKEPMLSINKVIIEGTALTVDLSALGNKAHLLTLPNIELSAIGGEKGLPASQIGSEIMRQALDNIWQETKKAQKDKLKDEALDKLKDKAKDKLKSLFG